MLYAQGAVAFQTLSLVLTHLVRGGTSPEKVGLTRGKTDCQKVYLTFFMLFLLRNEYRSDESGVGMSTPVHPAALPLHPVKTTFQSESKSLNSSLLK